MKKELFAKTLGTLGSADVVEIAGIAFVLDPPEAVPDVKFVGREEIIGKALLAWKRVDGCPPLKFRLYGPHGCGKTAIVYELARILKKDLYVISGTQEFDAGDITCVPIPNSKGKYGRILFHATGLLAAAVRGGVCLFDELDKLSEAGKSGLIPILNETRIIQSVLTGIRMAAHEDFFFCAATNENREEGNWLEEKIDCKIRPAFYVGRPSTRELDAILESHLPTVPGNWRRLLLSEFEELSARNALNLLQYGFSRFTAERDKSGRSSVTERDISSYLHGVFQEVVQ